MKIGIIGAMEEKLRCCVTKLTTVERLRWAAAKIYTGRLNGTSGVAEIGIGKVAAALGATLLLGTASRT